MQERLKELPKKFLEYWNKWTSKQKTIIISSVAAVLLLIGILVFVLGRTKYVELYRYGDTKTASQIVTLLKGNSIATKLASDNLTVMVDETAYSDAIMQVATSDLADSSFGIDGLLDTSITTTNGERLLRNHIYLVEEMVDSIQGIDGVIKATITYIPKDTANRILTSSQSIPASVMLWTNNEFKKSSAEAIAKYIAFSLGNTDTSVIKIVDQGGNVLYDGPETEEDEEINITDKISTENFFCEKYIKAVTGAFLMAGFTSVDVAPHLEINFDRVEQLFEEVLPYADGEDRGILTEYHSTAATGTGTTGDIPGTDSNNETDYYLTGTNGGNYSSSSEDAYYTPSKRVTNTVYDTGTLSAENSSVSVTAVRVIKRTEEDLKTLGLLNNVTFDEYVLAHSDQVLRDEDTNLIELVSMATGIPTRNIKVMAYDVFEFEKSVSTGRDWSFYLQILLAVLLIGFLAFVIFRGMAPVEVTELEPELSVEQLLATTKENQSLEDVEFSEQSETRKMIEKFFDENPEAVASLLRNWLNDDWN